MPLPGREPEPDVLRRWLIPLAALLALSAPSAARAGTFSSQNGTITYQSNPGDSDQIAGFDAGSTIRSPSVRPSGPAARTGATSRPPSSRRAVIS